MFLVFDVGGTFIKYALMSRDGEITEKDKVPTPVKQGQGFSDFIEALGSIYDRYAAKETVEGIAIGLPGQIDVENGIVYGGGGLRYMANVNLKKPLMERCGGTRVAMENDGKCAALAEVWKGNAKDVQDACVLVFGTGVGGGIIHNRKVLHGKRMTAGEFSFFVENLTRGDLDKLQCIEDMSVYEAVERVPFFWAAYAATGSLCFRMAKKRGVPIEQVTGEKIYEWAEEGDEEAIEALEDMYFAIARKCLDLYVALDPEVILIGGGISANPKFVEGIKKYVKQIQRMSIIYKEIKIDVCQFKNDSNLLGALYNYLQIYEME